MPLVQMKEEVAALGSYSISEEPPPSTQTPHSSHAEAKGTIPPEHPLSPLPLNVVCIPKPRILPSLHTERKYLQTDTSLQAQIQPADLQLTCTLPVNKHKHTAR